MVGQLIPCNRFGATNASLPCSADNLCTGCPSGTYNTASNLLSLMHHCLLLLCVSQAAHLARTTQLQTSAGTVQRAASAQEGSTRGLITAHPQHPVLCMGLV